MQWIAVVIWLAIVLIVSLLWTRHFDEPRECSGECETCPFPPCEKARNVDESQNTAI